MHVIRLIIVGVVVALAGCVSPYNSATVDMRAPVYSYETDAMENALLLSRQRSRIIETYGPPKSTRVVDESSLIWDLHEPVKGLQLITCWEKDDPDGPEGLLEYSFNTEMSEELVRWHFQQPEDPNTQRALQIKMKLLKDLKEKLVGEGQIEDTVTEYDEFGLKIMQRVSQPLNDPVGTEVCYRNGEKEAQGVYHGGSPWEGTFCDVEQYGSFYYPIERQYQDGDLIRFIIPSWFVRGREMENARVAEIFRTGPRSDVSLDDGAFNWMLRDSGEKEFLNWADENNVEEGYRVTYAPYFDRKVVFNVVFEAENTSPYMEWIVVDIDKELSRKEVDEMNPFGSDHNAWKYKRAYSDRRNLMLGEVEELLAIIDRSILWEQCAEAHTSACDGVSYNYEGVRDKRYVYRSSSNPSAFTTAALAEKLRSMVFVEKHVPPFAKSKTKIYQYHFRVTECVESALALLECNGHDDLVDELLEQPDALRLAKCLKKADHYWGQLAQETPSVEDLLWDDSGMRLLALNGEPYRLSCSKEFRSPENYWTYTLQLNVDDPACCSTHIYLQFTAQATWAAQRAEPLLGELSPLALKELEKRQLDPKDAVLLDASLLAKGQDHIESVLVCPLPAKFPELVWSLTVDHSTGISRSLRYPGNMDAGWSDGLDSRDPKSKKALAEQNAFGLNDPE